MQHSQLIGITGGIGSGKSTICRVLESMGYPVYYSDQRAKDLMNTDPQLIGEIESAFGKEAYAGGELNRKAIAHVVFNHPEKRDLLNSIVHPRVRRDFRDWADEQASRFVFQESALLFETGGYKNFDKTILVTAPEELRIARIMERDKSSEEEIRARIANQLPDAEKIPLADFVIDNNDSVLVIPQIERILEELG